ncbi:MAG: tRNA pseudouridine(55) synthase TruB [Thermoguttaceae bacterium]|jgi:tRNA pseudouridine55 synthase
MALSGILNINKPIGMTSREVVDIIQRLVRPAKVGHAGTLDPLAAGVLVVCVGSATRLIEYVQRMPKSYIGMFLLGRWSETEDIEGEILEMSDPPVPALKEITFAAKKLEGNILQRPPAFSALKINGRRAYKMARSGERVELQPRPVTVHRIAIRSYEYPRLVLEVDCGGGTYIRSLGRDLAESLGTRAVMSALVRTAIGKFGLDAAQDPGKLSKENIAGRLLPMISAVDYLPRLELSAEEIRRVHRGQAIAKRIACPDAADTAAVDKEGNLVAILSSSDAELLRPVRNFLCGIP